MPQTVGIHGFYDKPEWGLQMHFCDNEFNILMDSLWCNKSDQEMNRRPHTACF